MMEISKNVVRAKKVGLGQNQPTFWPLTLDISES